MRRLVEEAAAAAEVPASFVRAIAREESSFDPNAVSWAHAYGLVQVILPTARRHADGLTIDARTLRRPEVNLAVGSRYMRSLRDRYATNPAVVPGGLQRGPRGARPLASRAWAAAARRVRGAHSLRRDPSVHAPRVADVVGVHVARRRPSSRAGDGAASALSLVPTWGRRPYWSCRPYSASQLARAPSTRTS
ncbi:MAG: transglycosylase SLT domain-containing protein [Sandaracinus sp.]|nr:transglycosylase SLT domain-containing protein [Sandaracinus sp.]